MFYASFVCAFCCVDFNMCFGLGFLFVINEQIFWFESDVLFKVILCYLVCV
jgi:hypothetical protein